MEASLLHETPVGIPEGAIDDRRLNPTALGMLVYLCARCTEEDGLSDEAWRTRFGLTRLDFEREKRLLIGCGYMGGAVTP